MGIVDDIRIRGVSSRVTEEVLYAEALREVENGIRRDGLWAKALADSKMNQNEAQAYYLKLRVQSLRDEIQVAAQEAERNERALRKARDQTRAETRSLENSDKPRVRDQKVQGFREWLNVFIGAVLVIGVGIAVATAFQKLK